MQGASDSSAVLSLGQLFTFLFVMLGPFKLLGPFTHITRGLDDTQVRKIGVRAFGIAVAAVVAGASVGTVLMQNWNVSIAALTLAGGLIFLLVGLQLVLQQYEPPHPEAEHVPAATSRASPFALAMRITFPAIVTPYGIAAVIVLVAQSDDIVSTGSILAIVIAIMVVNLLAMLYARWIMGGLIVVALQILGAVLGVLQVALAIQLILRAFTLLGVLQG
jgi:small neutral amino acid transporter SnatA (MarC family)